MASHSSSGLKYSRMADPSIISCPVIDFMTSGQGRDAPIASPALVRITYCHSNNFLIFIFFFCSQ
jgi:hypothetical protein